MSEYDPFESVAGPTEGRVLSSWTSTRSQICPSKVSEEANHNFQKGCRQHTFKANLRKAFQYSGWCPILLWLASWDKKIWLHLIANQLHQIASYCICWWHLLCKSCPLWARVPSAWMAWLHGGFRCLHRVPAQVLAQLEGNAPTSSIFILLPTVRKFGGTKSSARPWSRSNWPLKAPEPCPKGLAVSRIKISLCHGLPRTRRVSLRSLARGHIGLTWGLPYRFRTRDYIPSLRGTGLC